MFGRIENIEKVCRTFLSCGVKLNIENIKRLVASRLAVSFTYIGTETPPSQVICGCCRETHRSEYCVVIARKVTKDVAGKLTWQVRVICLCCTETNRGEY